MNRRLVPMPTKKAAAPSIPAAPPTLKTWHCFAFLLVTAVVMYYAKWPILIIAAIVGLIRGWTWLSWRFPRTMWFVNAFIAGLLRRR